MRVPVRVAHSLAKTLAAPSLFCQTLAECSIERTHAPRWPAWPATLISCQTPSHAFFVISISLNLLEEDGFPPTNAGRLPTCSYLPFPLLSLRCIPLTDHLIEQRLAVFLDRPGFPWKKLIIGFSLGQFVLEGLLSLRQYQVLQNKKPPKTLEDEISQDVFDQSQVCAYSVLPSCHTRID